MRSIRVETVPAAKLDPAQDNIVQLKQSTKSPARECNPNFGKSALGCFVEEFTEFCRILEPEL